MHPDEISAALNSEDARRNVDRMKRERAAEAREALLRSIMSFCFVAAAILLALDSIGLYGLGRISLFVVQVIVALLMILSWQGLRRLPRTRLMVLPLALAPIATLSLALAQGHLFTLTAILSVALLAGLVRLAWVRTKG